LQNQRTRQVDRQAKSMEKRFLREGTENVNVGNTIVMRCSDEPSAAKESSKCPCAICSKGIGSNSVRCAKCKIWVYKKCRGVTVIISERSAV
jgi:hypothetical protein